MILQHRLNLLPRLEPTTESISDTRESLIISPVYIFLELVVLCTYRSQNYQYLYSIKNCGPVCLWERAEMIYT